jgi:hypothetical protein
VVGRNREGGAGQACKKNAKKILLRFEPAVGRCWGRKVDGSSGERLLTLVQLGHGPAKGLEPLTRMRFLFSDYIHRKECR